MFSSPIGTAFAALAFAVTASQAGPNVLLARALTNTSQSGYTLEDDYTPSNFFKMFDFFNVCTGNFHFKVRLTSARIRGLKTT